MPHLTLPISTEGCIIQLDVGITKKHEATLRKTNQGLYHPAFSLLKEKVLIIGNDFTGQNINAIIGRDLLKSCLLVYNGTNKTFTLGF